MKKRQHTATKAPAVPSGGYSEPGHTQGKAEGGRDDEDDHNLAADEYGRTAGSAEGDRETVEEDLRRLFDS